MKRVAASAQAFGYGPASKLVTFVKNLTTTYPNEYCVDFYGVDIALSYAQQNFRHFNEINPQTTPINKNIDYDLIISAMDPDLVLWGVAHKKKIIYIDSLYWFWKWNANNYPALQEKLKLIRNADSYEEVLSLTKDIDPHSMQYIAHALADISLVQFFPNTNKAHIEDIFRKSIKVNKVGYMIDATLKRDSLQRTKVLITLSGLLSPLNRIEDAVKYYDFINELIEVAVQNIPRNIGIHLTVNPLLLQHVKKLNQRVMIHSLDHDMFLDLLNESLVVIAPAGITTILESLTYNTPIIFLPEQHDGHYENYRLLSVKNHLQSDEPVFPELLFNTRVKRGLNENPDGELQEIQKLVKEHSENKHSKIVNDMKQTMREAVDIVLDPIKRAHMLEAQRKAVISDDSVLSIERSAEIVQNMFR